MSQLLLNTRCFHLRPGPALPPTCKSYLRRSDAARLLWDSAAEIVHWGRQMWHHPCCKCHASTAGAVSVRDAVAASSSNGSDVGLAEAVWFMALRCSTKLGPTSGQLFYLHTEKVNLLAAHFTVCAFLVAQPEVARGNYCSPTEAEVSFIPPPVPFAALPPLADASSAPMSLALSVTSWHCAPHSI